MRLFFYLLNLISMYLNNKHLFFSSFFIILVTIDYKFGFNVKFEKIL